MKARRRLGLWLAGVALVAGCGPCDGSEEELRLLNVSYDPTRELFESWNQTFTNQWATDHNGQQLTIEMSHGGSGKQARAVLEGLEADVVTLGVEPDITALVDGGLVDPGWAEEPGGGAPWTSTVVFVVRAGNPKGVRGWADLTQPGLTLVLPNPRTSGGARWIYLAAWGWALRQEGGDDAKAEAFVAQLYRRAPVLDTGARGSSTTFARNKIGDVLLTWENEAMLLQRELASAGFEIVTPAVSILAEPPAAVVDRVVERRGTRALATAYLESLRSPAAQTLAAEQGYRPTDPAVAARFADRFPPVERFTVQEVAGSWAKAQAEHFNEGGRFDRLYTPGGAP